MSLSSIEISWEASSSESSSKEIITQSKEIITPSRTTFKIEHQIGGTLSDWLIALHHDDNKQWEEFCQRANQAIQNCNYEDAIDYLTNYAIDYLTNYAIDYLTSNSVENWEKLKIIIRQSLLLSKTESI